MYFAHIRDYINRFGSQHIYRTHFKQVELLYNIKLINKLIIQKQPSHQIVAQLRLLRLSIDQQKYDSLHIYCELRLHAFVQTIDKRVCMHVSVHRRAKAHNITILCEANAATSTNPRKQSDKWLNQAHMCFVSQLDNSFNCSLSICSNQFKECKSEKQIFLKQDTINCAHVLWYYITVQNNESSSYIMTMKLSTLRSP